VTRACPVARALGPAEWLQLTAAPTFAIMALLTGLDGSPMNNVCPSGPAAPINGMAAMYLFMSMFHLPPWLKLIRRPTARTNVA